MRLKFKLFTAAGPSILKAILFRKRAPVFVNWSITNRCLFQCQYCGLWNKATEELSTGQIFDLIDELKKSQVKLIDFTGGEPLLRADIGSIIEHAKSRGIFSILNLSGALVGEKKAELGSVSAVKLSLEGPKDIHDLIRGDNSFDKVMKAIDIFKQMRKEIMLCSVLTKYNLKYIEYIIDVAREFNVPVSFQPASLNLLGSNEANPISPPREEYRETIDKLLDIKRTRLGKYIFNSTAGLRHIYHWPESKKMHCGGGIIFCRIEPNADLLLCARQNNATKLNCVQMGLREAFDKLKAGPCNSCWCAGVIECNYLLVFRLGSILNLFKIKF